MGELSKKNGAKLENFGEVLFQNLGWELLVQDFEINCINKNHKNKKIKTKKHMELIYYLNIKIHSTIDLRPLL